MQIILKNDDIIQAIKDHVLSTCNVSDDTNIEVDLKMLRKGKGAEASITITRTNVAALLTSLPTKMYEEPETEQEKVKSSLFA